MKERLCHIAGLRGRRPRGAVTGALLAVALAAIMLTTVRAETTPLAGWSVVRLAIPKEGELKDAHVELKSPEGRRATLAPGVESQEGVSIEKLEWAGAPLRAKVTLRQGDARADLFADSAAVVKDDTLDRTAGHVEIEARMIELPAGLARTIPQLDTPPAAEGAGEKAPLAAPRAVISEQEYTAWLRRLNQTKGVDVLSAPRVITRSQQAALVEIVRELRYATAWDPPDAKSPLWTPKTFETRNLGLTFAFEPVLKETGIITLKLKPEMVELAGFIDAATKKPLGEVKPDPAAPLIERSLAPLPNADAPAAERRTPIFRTRKASAEVTVQPGETAIFALEEMEGGGAPIAPGAGKILVAFVSARSVTREQAPALAEREKPGTKEPSASEPAPKAPYGKPVPGKPGFVTSPFAPAAGYIDVRGFPAGTEVEDPYTGKIFLVPPSRENNREK